jgi:D-aspartate ligase
LADIRSIISERLIRRTQRPVARTGAVVIGGDYRGLGLARSLGRHGIPVWVLTDEHLIAATSRYARRRLPWPAACGTRQLDYLVSLSQRHQLEEWAIFPTGDETAALLSRNNTALSKRFRLTTPPWDVMQWAYDKRLTYSLAADLGIDHPSTRYPKNAEDLTTVDWPFPVILKPAYKESVNRFTYAKAWRAENLAALKTLYAQACALVDPSVIMVQELVPGGGEAQFSYAALCADGHPIASLVARRTRQYPMDFGLSSSYVETVDQPEIEEAARVLLAQIRYTGLVEVEFKRDLRDGRYKLLDVNPRVWGWHTLGQRAGIDFSFLLWRLTQGESLPEMRGSPGMRWVRMVTDLPTVGLQIRRGALSLHDYRESLRGPLEFAIFAADDPLPALAEVPLYPYLLWKRRSGRQNLQDWH